MWREWLPILHGSLIVAAVLIILWGINRPYKKKPRR